MDQLRRKMLDFTENPPPGVWQQVESALEQELPEISKKLATYSSEPPANLWNKIESELDGKKEGAKVVPFSKIVRIASAAVILVAVFMTVRMFRPEAGNNQITSVPENSSPSPSLGSPKDTNTDNDPDPVEKKNISVAKTYIKTPAPPVIDKSSQAAKKTRYTTMSNDDGQTVRLSKKVAPVFDCAEARIKSISSRCKEDIKALQQKISSSLTSPSADFSGLIDLLQSLEQDQ